MWRNRLSWHTILNVIAWVFVIGIIGIFRRILTRKIDIIGFFRRTVSRYTQWENRLSRTTIVNLQLGIAFLILFLILEISQLIQLHTFNWPVLNALIIIYMIQFVTRSRRWLQPNIIEHEHRFFRLFRYGLYILIALPIFLYTLQNLTIGVSNDLNNQIMLFSVSSSIVGFIISLLGSKIAMREHIRRELISSTQKFAFSLVLVVIFVPSIKLVDMLGPINIESPAFDGASIGRGVYFWFSATCFYYAIYLFTVALIDFAIALRGLGENHKTTPPRGN